MRTFVRYLQTHTRLHAILRRTTPSYNSIFQNLTLFHVRRSTAQFATSVNSTLRRPLVLYGIGRKFKVDNSRAIIHRGRGRYTFKRTATGGTRLPISTLMHTSPFIKVPAMVIPSLVNIPRVRVYRAKHFYHLHHNYGPFSQVVIKGMITTP